MNQRSSNAPLHVDSAQALRDAVRDALRTGVPLVDYGSTVHYGLGHGPPTPHTRIVQTGGVIEHEARDLLVRVDGGCRMDDLQAALSQAGQCLPVDADDEMSVSELIAHNVAGPLRLGFGGLRDQLLGLVYVDGLGELVRVGGRTVKNKAGYDVTRLMVGSLNELGLIAEATLRTAVAPEQVQVVDVRLDEAEVIDALLLELLASEATAAWLSLHLDLDSGGFLMRMGYWGSWFGCHTQLRSLETLLDGWEDAHIVASSEESLASDQQQRAGHRLWRRHASSVVKLMVPPATTGFVCQSLAAASPGTPRPMVDAYPADGVIFVGGELDAEQAQRLDAQVGHVLEPVSGMRVWYARPGGAKIEPFTLPMDYEALKRLKRAMDPEGVFNPGRFIRLDERAGMEGR